jgi:hypothetical protein
MLNDWFYSHPTWQVMIAVCAVLLIISLLGLIPFHRLVNWEAREHDTAMIGLSYALAGGIYAVVIAFVAVGTYESMDKAAAIASEEANALSGLAFISSGLPTELAEHVRADVSGYIEIVTKKEWPKQQAYEMDDANFTEGWTSLRKISLEVASFEPATPGGATTKLEMEHSVNDLFSARRARLLAANEHLPDAIWQMLIVGLVFVLFYIYLFGPHSYKIHMSVVGLTMISIGLVFSLIIALDYPFRGDLSVDDDAYIGVKDTMAHIFEHANGPPHPGDAVEKKE